jgi:hypothetical protein
VWGLQNVLLACLLVGSLSGGVSGWYFYRDGRGDERREWLEAERKRSFEAADATRLAAAAEIRRAEASERQSSAVVSRVREVKRDAPVVDRPACEWADDERMRLQRIYEAYFGTPDSSGGVPGPVRPASGADGRKEGVGGANDGLGLRMPEATR